jgi:HD superfamily phosphohydrolase
VSGQLQVVRGSELQKYADRLRHSHKPNAKIIHDPVWRTIRLEPHEVILVDSPLLQRLRRIHQLGLASYVFPGANYTRFEHSVGVLHQTQRVIEAIKRNARSRSLAIRRHLSQQEPILPSEEVLLRVTALTHDVGHGFLSHVSERALSRISTVDGTHNVRQFQKEAKEFFQVPVLNAPPAFGEILSWLCVLLPEWQGVLSLARVPTWDDSAVLAFRMAQLMCGGRDPKRPFLSELISGPLDVDKLDYIPRDCYMAGVPMPVDVDRLLEKIQVVTVPAVSIPEYCEEAQVEPDDSIQVLAVQTSGSRAFEELVISRFLLYEKLYYHQKIRAMEGAVVSALEILREEWTEFAKITTYLGLSDDEFLLRHWPGQQIASDRLDIARGLVSGVVERDTLVRCYAFGPGLVKGLEQDSEEFRSRWKRLEPNVRAKRETPWFEFRKRIAARAKVLLRLIGQTPLADVLADEHIVVDLPPVQGIAEKTKFFVGDEEIGVAPFFTRFRVERWAEAYETQHTIGYVYTVPAFAVAVFFAVRDLVWSEHELSFDDASWTRTKLRSSELRDFSEKVAAKDAGHIPFSEPKFIIDRRAFATRNERKLEVIGQYSDVLDELVEKCKTFESHDGVRISVAGVRSWLLQFEPEDIVPAIRLLRAIRFWGRSALSDAMAFAVERYSNGFQALGLGAATSSAHHLSYLWDDVRTKVRRDFRVISTASEIQGNLPVVIYDDNVGSGGQAGTVFSQWFGMPSDSDLDEKHSDPLSVESIQKLKGLPIFLVFATGFRSGLDKISERLKGLTENPNISGLIIDPSDLSCFRPAARVFADAAEAERARVAFSNAGRIAIYDKSLKKDWSPEKLDDRILGYGNAGGLTVFHYNVPTTTVTALWSTSRSETAKWTALFPRRPREA